MIVFRLSRSRYKYDLSGNGAKIAGGRWNSIGIPVVYTAESRALAALEIAVHTPLNVVPEDYMMVTIFIPKASIHEIQTKDLPPNLFPKTGIRKHSATNTSEKGPIWA